MGIVLHAIENLPTFHYYRTNEDGVAASTSHQRMPSSWSYPVSRAPSSTPPSRSASGASSASALLVLACCATSCRRNHYEVINPEPPAHWRKKRGGQLKTWMTTLNGDLARLSGPDVFGLRRLNRDWVTIGIAWAQDGRAWAASVGDAVVAMDAGATAPR